MTTAVQHHIEAKTEPSFTPVHTGLLQRKCACGGSAGITGNCGECGNQHLSLQRASLSPGLEAGRSNAVPSIVHEVLNSAGQPLDPQTRAFMEPRFGHSFSRVRVHTDSKAAESAHAVNAAAYTVGSHIAFGSKQYAPTTSAGKHLIAHELTHSIQQASSNPESSTLEIGHPADTRENEADLAADQILSRGSTVGVSGTTAGQQIIQREELGEGTGADTPTTTEVPADSTAGATPMTAPVLPRPFRFQVSTGEGAFSNVFRSPANGRFSITAQAVMSAHQTSREPYWIQPKTRGFHLNGDEKEYTTGAGNQTRSWDIAGDVDCSLAISTANTNPNNALAGSGTIDP